MDKSEFIRLVQRRTSQVSVGPSALRNQGSGGLVEKCHSYFEKSINLKEFGRKLSTDKYADYLDTCTKELVDSFPTKGKRWGAARKGLNLFFREVIYNKYLADYLGLPSDFEDNLKSIKLLEVPLDRDVATGLISKFSDLPKWKSIKDLTANQSKIYQESAAEYASLQGIVRIHLDLEFWRRER